MNSGESQPQPIAFVETPQPIVELMLSLVSNHKLDKSEISVLDTGCGKGVFLRHLAELVFKNVTGIEYDKDLADTCEKEFSDFTIINNNFLNWSPKIGFDLIIGNPPYEHYNSLPVEMQKYVSKIVKSKESDIYYAFIIQAIDCLKENGELIFIVPYGFFYNTYAKIVREKIISNGTIDVIIDLDEVRLFTGENPETIIFKFTKKPKSQEETMTVLRIKDKNLQPQLILKSAQATIKKKQSNQDFEYLEKPMFQDSEEIWTTYPDIIFDDYVLLKDIAWVGVGPVSGHDEAFRLKDDEEYLFNEHEKELIIKTIKAINCAGYWTEGHVKYLFLDRSIATEQEMSQLLPNIASKISKCRKEMTVRYLPGSVQWFQWQALRNMNDYVKFAEKQKIFVPTLDRSKTNRFSMSDEFLYASGDVLAIVPLTVDPFFLLGYLNSDFFREYYLSAGARRGHRIAFTQRILSNIQIPLFTDEIEKEIASLTQHILLKKDISRRKEIERLIQHSFEEKLFRE